MTVFRINHENADGDVRTETFNGADHTVAPAIAARAMELNGGYVPQQEWVKSAPAWNGTPVTLTHPTDDDGRPVLANTPAAAEQTWFGHFFNVEAVDGGDALEGEVWFNQERVTDLPDDAGDALRRVENGESVDVSTAYFADRLESGEYDGEHRDAVVGNLRPEHLALLPNEEGKCSVEDGCGVPTPTGNAAEPVGMADVPAGETVVVVSGGVATQADDADTTDGVPDDGASSDAEDLDGSDGSDGTDAPDGDGDDDSAIRHALNTLATALGRKGVPHGPEHEPIANDAGGRSGADSTNGNMSEHDQMIDTLVDNFGYDRDDAEAMSDAAVQTTYEQLTNDGGGDGGCGCNTNADEPDEPTSPPDDDDDDDEAEPSAPVDNAEEIVAELKDELADEFVTQSALEDTLDTIDERQKRQSQIDEIVANSDEYDAEDLAETPADVVDNIHSNVVDTSTATFAAVPGASANGAAGDDELDKWEQLVNRASGDGAEAEGGD